MKFYFWEVHWKDGKVETLRGFTFAGALNNAGYGNGAVPAIDHYKCLR